MYTEINGFFIETGYGFNPKKSTVTTIVGVDAFGRYIFGKCVFIGDWEECKAYALGACDV